MRLTLSRPPRVDLAEASRYLRGGNGDAVADDLTRAAADLLAAARPAAAAVWHPLERGGAGLSMAGIPLPGDAITRHLDGCAACVLLGVTLGFEVDRLISAAGQTAPYRALLLDACAAAAAEDLAELAEEALRRLPELADYGKIRRFSPGYGDLPLALQPALLNLLDARRVIGLTVGASLMLSPVKSITALIGLTLSGCDTLHEKGCATCPMRDRCLYRRA